MLADDGLANRPLSFSTGGTAHAPSPLLRGLQSGAYSLKHTFSALSAPTVRDVSVSLAPYSMPVVVPSWTGEQHVEVFEILFQLQCMKQPGSITQLRIQSDNGCIPT